MTRRFLGFLAFAFLLGLAALGCSKAPPIDPDPSCPPPTSTAASSSSSTAGGGGGGAGGGDVCMGPECVSCSDGHTNGMETDVDCGGSYLGQPWGSCPRCGPGKHCYENADCESYGCVLNGPDHNPPYGGTCL